MMTQTAQGSDFDKRETSQASSAATATNGHAPDSLALTREAVQALPAAIYTTDAEGRITFYNDAAADLWGCRSELGKTKFCGSWKLYWKDGTPLSHDDCPMAMALKEKRAIRGMETVAERHAGFLHLISDTAF
jgi:PAS domain-containing protein